MSVILFNTAVLANGHRLVLDSYSLGACWVPIISETKASVPGAIMVYLEDLVLDDGQRPIDLKIPLLLFRYEDILNFTTLPSMEECGKGYASNYSSTNLSWENYFLKDSVDFEENQFILDSYKQHNKIDKRRIYNGFLDVSKMGSNSGIILSVYESGIYCAYIAPPIDKGIKMMIAPVKVKYSELFSSDMWLANYSQTKYILGIGLLLAAYLISDILKCSTDNQLNIKNIPIISKTVIFYVLLPFLSFISLAWFCDIY